MTNKKSINLHAVKHVTDKTEELIALVMEDDFYGSVSLELVVTEGIVRNIKTNITRNLLVERRKP